MAHAGRLVIALGGNAILQRDQAGTAAEQEANIRATCRQIAGVVALGYEVVLTHGNGPQVGNRLLQNEEAARLVPAMPLHVCVAETQGQIGYWFQQALSRALNGSGPGVPVATVVTQVVVDPADPAFANPTKPVGPFYSPDRARAFMISHGWNMKEDAGRGWRRVVASPRPLRIVEAELIRRLVDGGAVVISAGGGGVPVAETPDGLIGIEAVIDKDLGAQILAATVGAPTLLILTDVPQVLLHYGRPTQRALGHVALSEAEAYVAEGHFAAGSMGPKVDAAIRHLRAGGARAIITGLHEAAAALAGEAGTHFVPDPVQMRN